MFQTVVRSLTLLTLNQRTRFLTYALMTFGLNLLDLAGIALLGVLGATVVSGNIPHYLEWLGIESSRGAVVSLLGFATFAFLLKTSLGIALSKKRQLFLASLERHFSRQISEHFFNSNLATVKQHSRADFEWAILRSTHIAFGSVLAQALNFLAEASLALLILGFFFYTDWLSASLVTVYLGTVILAFQVATRLQTSKTGADYRAGSVNVVKSISDILSNFREIMVLSKMNFFLAELDRTRAMVAEAQAKQFFFQAIPRLVVELAVIVGAFAFVILQVSLANQALDLSTVSVFLIGSLRMMSALLPLYRAFMQLRYDMPQARASQQLLEKANKSSDSVVTLKEVGNAPNLPTPPSQGLSVEMVKVFFNHEDGESRRNTLSDVSISIAPGTTVALIGPSGSGKSTILDLVVGLNSPSRGEIRVSGLAPDVLRARFPGIFGYVPQKPGLVRGSLANNIALGVDSSDIDYGALSEAIRAADLEDFVTSLPSGIHSSFGEQFDSLSGGQAQRIGLARALYTRPKLVVLDEATSALDAETEASITSNLARLSYRPTTIIVAHRLSTVKHAENVFLIDSGRVVASGDFRTLEKTVPLVKTYVDLMSV